MYVHELIELLSKEDPNREIRLELARTCSRGCDCGYGQYDYVSVDVDTRNHQFITIS